jgi:hypothetical protein
MTNIPPKPDGFINPYRPDSKAKLEEAMNKQLPYPMCRNPNGICEGKGYCPLEFACND